MATQVRQSPAAAQMSEAAQKFLDSLAPAQRVSAGSCRERMKPNRHSGVTRETDDERGFP